MNKKYLELRVSDLIFRRMYEKPDFFVTWEYSFKHLIERLGKEGKIKEMTRHYDPSTMETVFRFYPTENCGQEELALLLSENQETVHG